MVSSHSSGRDAGLTWACRQTYVGVSGLYNTYIRNYQRPALLARPSTMSLIHTSLLSSRLEVFLARMFQTYSIYSSALLRKETWRMRTVFGVGSSALLHRNHVDRYRLNVRMIRNVSFRSDEATGIATNHVQRGDIVQLSKPYVLLIWNPVAKKSFIS